MSSKILNRFLNILKSSAVKSTVATKLAAGILYGKKLVSKPCCNIDRSYCKKNNISSLHAEEHAILMQYKKYLFYDKSKERLCLK
jgi:hypothetical protein